MYIDMEDLFEHYEDLPIEVQKVIDNFNAKGNSYDNCNELIDELNKVGYTCEYGLDASPYNLRKILGSKEEQEILFYEVIKKAEINTVTCGNCGTVLFHRVKPHLEELHCPYCNLTTEPCHFPDLYS